MEIIILGGLAIPVVVFVGIKLLIHAGRIGGKAIDKLSDQAKYEYGESKSVHEHTKKMARIATRETVGGGSEEQAEQKLDDAKVVAKEAALLAGKGAILGAKGIGWSLKTAHQLYFNTEEAKLQLKKDMDSVPGKWENTKKAFNDKIDAIDREYERKEAEAQEKAKANRVKPLKFDKDKKDDKDDYIPILEFASAKGISPDKAMTLIQHGVHQGKLFDDRWYVHKGELVLKY